MRKAGDTDWDVTEASFVIGYTKISYQSGLLVFFTLANIVTYSDIDKMASTKFFFLIFGGHKSFCGATDTPVLDFWWCLTWVSKPG